MIHLQLSPGPSGPVELAGEREGLARAGLPVGEEARVDAVEDLARRAFCKI